MKLNFKPLYKKLSEKDDRIRTVQDATTAEKKKLDPAQQLLLRKLQEKAVKSETAIKVDAKRLGFNISDQAAKEIESEVAMRRGSNAESRGLKMAEAEEMSRAKQQKAVSDKLQQGAQLLSLQVDAFDTMQDLISALKTLDPSAAAELLRSDLEPAKGLLPKRIDPKEAAKTLAAKSSKLRKDAAKMATPFQAGNTRMFRAEVIPGVRLCGKIDAHRQVAGEGPSEIHIFEHKARQRRLFQKLKDYEKIQCLAYIDLVKREQTDAGVRCFLVETFQGSTWQCEVEDDQDLWQDKVLSVVGRRASELRDLMRPDTSSERVREWLDHL